MPEANYRVRNITSNGFCDFTSASEALIFYRDGISRFEKYEFVLLHPEKFLNDLINVKQDKE